MQGRSLVGSVAQRVFNLVWRGLATTSLFMRGRITHRSARGSPGRVARSQTQSRRLRVRRSRKAPTACLQVAFDGRQGASKPPAKHRRPDSSRCASSMAIEQPSGRSRQRGSVRLAGLSPAARVRCRFASVQLDFLGAVLAFDAPLPELSDPRMLPQGSTGLASGMFLIVAR